MKTASTVLLFVGSICAVDFLGFMLWAMSGQFPADGFFIGALTRYVVAAF